ncbi:MULTISPECIES: hypothetical protein [unclassified Leeuwenhoekiella]|uniref:hypothetical protein n=1 Tax=unclassified Leeuwenhoekiella TaxID=2615029 RepID=UPI000C687D18|nr:MULTISPECIES: hypothetical protein [unclassified Leeuwenhoekiella]MAW94216.1 hypothetical protein [Leeuwenhoekiella sp.]MAW96870.1 hypothetical protein [Leeuwenhoekiella sp.]|tara:strand:- start:3844 stop:4314 length:471 start_codon:yes stop_codon:yes gene_type:complete
MTRYLIVFAVLIISCKPSTGKKGDAMPVEETETVSTSEPDSLSQQNEPVFESAADEKLALMQGTWYSTDDPKSYLEVNDEQLVMGYEGMDLDPKPYTMQITDQLPNREPSNSDTQYLILTQEGETMNYAIDDLTENDLKLLYLSRGNFLNYTRTKN